MFLEKRGLRWRELSVDFPGGYVARTRQQRERPVEQKVPVRGLVAKTSPITKSSTRPLRHRHRL